MHRIESALLQNRCVFVLGDGLINAKSQVELSKRNIPAVSITGETLDGIHPFSKEAFAPATEKNGVVVLVDPSLSEEHIDELATLLKESNPRPQIFIVSKAYNRFSLPMVMLGWKLHQLKYNGLPFLRALKAPSKNQEQAKPKNTPTKERLSAPQRSFLGREKEVDILQGFLQEEGAPIFIQGPVGIGKRWLLEHAVQEQNLVRVPELVISANFQSDALLGRIAEHCNALGSSKLLQAISGKKRPTPAKLVDLFVESLQLPELQNSLFVISGFDYLINSKDNYFYREGLIELLLQRLFHSSIALKIVVLVTELPFFLSPESTRLVALKGIKKEHVADFMSSWQAPELTEDQVTSIFERTHGHPIALKHIALSLRNAGNTDTLDSQPGFGQLKSLNDTNKLKNVLKRRLDKLPPKELEALEHLALFHAPVSSVDISEIGVNRKMRMSLIRNGVLEQSPNVNLRLHYLNPLLRVQLKFRKVYDFKRMEELGDLFLDKARDANPKGKPEKANLLHETVAIQKANALFLRARKRKRCWTSRTPFCDPIVYSARELLFSKDKEKGLLDIAFAQIRGGLKNNPNHPDLLLLEVLAMKKDRSRKHDLNKAFSNVQSKASVPESYHQESNFHLERNAFDRAIQSLTTGSSAFPQSSQLSRRLAGILVRQGQLPEACASIESAIESFPTNPDYHSLHGEILTRLGRDSWEKASQSYQKARELYQKTPAIHLVREAELKRVQAMIDVDQRTELLKESEQLLREALKHEKNHLHAQVTLACVLLDLNTEEHAEVEKLLAPSVKKRDRSDAFVQKARLLIRQGNLTDVESHLDRAFKLARKNHQLFTIRGEYYLATNEPLLALKAFQKAMDTCPNSAPEYEVNKRYIEQVSMIIAANSNVDYSASLPTVSTIPALEGEEAAPQVLRRPKKDK